MNWVILIVYLKVFTELIHRVRNLMFYVNRGEHEGGMGPGRDRGLQTSYREEKSAKTAML